MKIKLLCKNEKLCENYIKGMVKDLKIISKYNRAGRVVDYLERVYIEKFIEENRKYIRGKVLEFKGTENYAHRYVDSKNITYCAGAPLKSSYAEFNDIKFFFDFEDIATFPTLSSSSMSTAATEFVTFDCIIFTQCLVYTLNPVLVLSNLEKLLNPNGVILISSSMSLPNIPDAPFLNFISLAGLKVCCTKLADRYETLSLKTYGNAQNLIRQLFFIKRPTHVMSKNNSDIYPLLVTGVIKKRENAI